MKTAIAAVIAFLSIGGVLVYHSSHDQEGATSHAQLPVLGKATDFSLTDSKGTTFSFMEHEGTVRVVNFFFANCPSICPAIHARMKEVHRKFKDDHNIHLISISVDPSRDTPEELEEYASRFRYNENWHFLTGKKEDINKVMEDIFFLGSGELPDEHTTRLVLVDRDNQIRGYYQGLEDKSVEELGMHIARIRRRS